MEKGESECNLKDHWNIKDEAHIKKEVIFCETYNFEENAIGHRNICDKWESDQIKDEWMEDIPVEENMDFTDCKLEVKRSENFGQKESPKLFADSNSEEISKLENQKQASDMSFNKHILFRRIQCSKYPMVKLKKLNISDHIMRTVGTPLNEQIGKNNSERISNIQELTTADFMNKEYVNTKERKEEYKCSFCSYHTKVNHKLTIHLGVHTGVKLYKCGTCSYSASHSYDLQAHLRIHTGEKPFKCDTCSYSASFRSALTAHLRIHTGEKPFKCSTCSYGASCSSDLKKHLRIHTGEKPFKCGTCSYSASQLGNLKKHLRIHTGEKPFKCGTCSFSASHFGNLKKHLRIHTGEKKNPHSK